MKAKQFGLLGITDHLPNIGVYFQYTQSVEALIKKDRLMKLGDI